MNNKTFVAVCLGVVVVTIVAGVATVGGPATARQDKFDQRRLDALFILAGRFNCIGKTVKPQPRLPNSLSIGSMKQFCRTDYIRKDLLADPQSGKPYRYIRVDDHHFRICADFHNAKRAVKINFNKSETTREFNPETGCITGSTIKSK